MSWLTTHKYDILAAFFFLLVVSGLVFVKKIFWPPERPVKAFITPPPANGMPIMAVESVELNTPLKIHSKKVAVKKLDLPVVIVNNPAKQITATAALKPSVGGYTVAAVVDTDTGVIDLIANEKPRSLFDFGGVLEVGLLGGVTTRGDSALVFVRQDLLRVGNVNIFGAGGAGVIGGSFGAGAFVGASVKW
jgi:hypothetical protein